MLVFYKLDIMITIIAGTNRQNSRTALVADKYASILSQKAIEHKLLKLKDLPHDIIHDNMYNNDGLSEKLIEIQENYILPANKMVIITPEYNGGVPGIFKLFVDAMCARKYKENFAGKKLSFIGVSSGRAGNLRGMESMTGFFNYLGAIVFPQKLPLSSIEGSIENEQLIAEKIDPIVIDHIDSFLRF